VTRLTVPGAAGAWSVKDLIALVVYYEQWWADRMAEALRGETFEPTAMDRLPAEARRQVIYRQHRFRPLADVCAEAHYSYRRLLRAVDAQPETLLIEALTYPCVLGPARLWERLQAEVCDRYHQHGAEIRAWLGGG
jgi:hypothetical protein